MITEAAAPATPPPPPTLQGTLHVQSDPEGATVTVDGETLGVTPLDVSEMAMGSHEVRVELKGHAPAIQTVALTADAPHAQLDLPLTRASVAQGTADITSTPSGALVRVDGISAGLTPVRDQRLRAGNHNVEVTAEGHEKWTGTLQVREGKRARLEVPLRAIPKATPTPEVADPNRIYDQNDVDKKPLRTSTVTATFPFKELKGKKEVSVTGTFVVTEKGEVTEIHIVDSGGPVLDQAVMAAVAKWKYAPGEKKGTKVRVRMSFVHTFRGN
jgi:TonB family protein